MDNISSLYFSYFNDPRYPTKGAEQSDNHSTYKFHNTNQTNRVSYTLPDSEPATMNQTISNGGGARDYVVEELRKLKEENQELRFLIVQNNDLMASLCNTVARKNSRLGSVRKSRSPVRKNHR